MKDYPGLTYWALTGEVGESSRALAHAVVFPSGRDYYTDPADFADFRRCERMMQEVPSIRADAMEAARTRMGPVWAALAAHWDELVTVAGDVAWRCRGSVPPPGWGLRFQQIRQSGWRGTQIHRRDRR